MVSTAQLESTSLQRLLVSLWCVLLLLVGLYAADIRQWAETDGVQGQRLAAAAIQVQRIADCTYLPQLKGAIQQVPHRLYDRPLMLCANLAPVPPPAPVQAMLTPANPGGAADAPVALAASFQPHRILIAGASSIQSGLGTALEAELARFDGVEIRRFGQHSTGLSRPDYFDWPAKLTELINDFQPDLIIGQWGENDCQGMTNADGSLAAKFGTDAWDAEYGRRVAQLIQTGRADGCRVVLLGIPHMRQDSFNNKVERLNQVTAQAAASAGAEFVSLWDLTTDEKGEFRATVEIDGHPKPMRSADGIHFSTVGAQYVATAIREHLEQEMVFILPAPGK